MASRLSPSFPDQSVCGPTPSLAALAREAPRSLREELRSPPLPPSFLAPRSTQEAARDRDHPGGFPPGAWTVQPIPSMLRLVLRNATCWPWSARTQAPAVSWYSLRRSGHCGCEPFTCGHGRRRARGFVRSTAAGAKQMVRPVVGFPRPYGWLFRAPGCLNRHSQLQARAATDWAEASRQRGCRHARDRDCRRQLQPAGQLTLEFRNRSSVEFGHGRVRCANKRRPAWGRGGAAASNTAMPSLGECTEALTQRHGVDENCPRSSRQSRVGAVARAKSGRRSRQDNRTEKPTDTGQHRCSLMIHGTSLFIAVSNRCLIEPSAGCGHLLRRSRCHRCHSLSSAPLIEARARGLILINQAEIKGWIDAPRYTEDLGCAKSLVPEGLATISRDPRIAINAARHGDKVDVTGVKCCRRLRSV